MASYVPMIGEDVQGILLGGPSVGSAALLRFYVLHVAVLPLALVLVLAVHLWRWRKDSMLELDAAGGDDG
jgi:quinol-cytochrome oxidoreductase complex cytochrome b subunit